MLLPAAGTVPAIVRLHIAADLEANVAARDVIEPGTEEVADSHILDRLGFYREIGCLRAADCGQCRSRPEKHTLRDCHGIPRMCVYGGPGKAQRSPARTFNSKILGGARLTWGLRIPATACRHLE